MDEEPLSLEWTCALAIRLINLGWFRVGTERYAAYDTDLRNHDSAQEPRRGSRQQDCFAIGESTALGFERRSSTRSSLRR